MFNTFLFGNLANKLLKLKNSNAHHPCSLYSLHIEDIVPCPLLTDCLYRSYSTCGGSPTSEGGAAPRGTHCTPWPILYILY